MLTANSIRERPISVVLIRHTQKYGAYATIVDFLVVSLKSGSNGIIDKTSMKYYYYAKEKTSRNVNLGRLR